MRKTKKGKEGGSEKTKQSHKEICSKQAITPVREDD